MVRHILSFINKSIDKSHKVVVKDWGNWTQSGLTFETSISVSISKLHCITVNSNIKDLKGLDNPITPRLQDLGS